MTIEKRLVATNWPLRVLERAAELQKLLASRGEDKDCEAPADYAYGAYFEINKINVTGDPLRAAEVLLDAAAWGLIALEQLDVAPDQIEIDVDSHIAPEYRHEDLKA